MSLDLAQPPYSTIIIMCLSVFMALLTSVLNRLIVSPEQREKVRALQSKVAALRKEKDQNLDRAKKEGDKKLLKKGRRQEKELLQLSSQMASLSFKQMKTIPIFMILFVIFWLLVTGRIDFFFIHLKLFSSPFSSSTIVAFLPWISGGVIRLNLITWYFLCSITAGIFFQRIFGLTGATE